MVAAALGFLIGGGEDDDDAPDAAAEVVEQAESRLTESAGRKDAGIRVRYPPNWKLNPGRTRELAGEARAVTLQSPDRCVRLTIAAPAAASRAARLRRDTIALARDSFERVKVSAGDNRRVGGLPTASNVLTVRGRGGDPARILLAVSRGEKRAYLTQVVLRAQGCERSLAEAQLILGSIALTG